MIYLFFYLSSNFPLAPDPNLTWNWNRTVQILPCYFFLQLLHDYLLSFFFVFLGEFDFAFSSNILL